MNENCKIQPRKENNEILVNIVGQTIFTCKSVDS